MLVALLNGLHLRLQLLHLAHRHDALVPQRQDDHVDQDGEHDDRPPPVADVSVDPGQGSVQRHDQPGEPAEVQGPDEGRVRRLENLEVLRPEEEGKLGARCRPGKREIEGHELARIAVELAGRQGHGPVGDDRLGVAGERGGQEVVVVDAREAQHPSYVGREVTSDASGRSVPSAESAPSCWMRPSSTPRGPTRYARPLLLDSTPPRAGPQRDDRHEGPPRQGGIDGDRDDEGARRIEEKLLADPQSAGVLELERQRLGAVAEPQPARAGPVRGPRRRARSGRGRRTPR